MTRHAGRLTSGAQLAIAGLHIAWGRGSAFPFTHRGELADAAVGTDAMPSPAACYGVASALTAAAALVGGGSDNSNALRRLGVIGVATILGMRALGMAGMTHLVSPGSTSVRFRRLDRRLYSPLCLALAMGSLISRR